MSLNIRVRFAETAEASALKPMEIEIINDDSLALAFKLNTKHPQRYITSSSHGLVHTKKNKIIYLRLRPPHEIVSEGVAPTATKSMPVSILKGSSRSRSPGSGGGGGVEFSSGNAAAPSSSGATASALVDVATELVQLEIRVITAPLAEFPSEHDFQKFWPTAFHHSSHTIPFKAVYLSELDYFSTLLERQEVLLGESEKVRADLQHVVESLQSHVKIITERNTQYEADVEKLRRRAIAAMKSARRRAQKVVVPTWIGLVAIAAAWYSSHCVVFV